MLRFEVWGYLEKQQTIVTRYNIAYINHSICSKDNGRVLGFDNAHGYHHRHHMGVVEPVAFESYEATSDRFQNEWVDIVKSFKEKKT